MPLINELDSAKITWWNSSEKRVSRLRKATGFVCMVTFEAEGMAAMML